MPMHGLVIEVRFPDGRYHGVGDWPPSPFRLFQALVAGAYGGQWISEAPDDKDSAFLWLERLDPPVVAAPPKRDGRAATYFVPNNDLDAVGGDPARVSKIRISKMVRPVIFDADVSLIYAWPFDGSEDHAVRLCEFAERLHTLGKGVDMAFASGEVRDWAAVEDMLHARQGQVARPTSSRGAGRELQCPAAGSLDSLKLRHAAYARRFQSEQGGKRTLFHQPPKARLRSATYDAPPARLLFEIRRADAPVRFHSFPQEEAVKIAAAVRDVAAAGLRTALPARSGAVDKLIVGREAGPSDMTQRVRFLGLPSIGTPYTSSDIRRVLVEIPPDCPFSTTDLNGVISGQSPVDPETGEILEAAVLVNADNRDMLRHYGIDRNEKPRVRVWRTITPAALPERAARRRIDPGRLKLELEAARKTGTGRFKEAKSARERMEEEGRAASAVLQALRHADVRAPVESVRVQREPFEAKGARAEAFAEGTRFAKERLWHVEITFADQVGGPLVIGDGRYLGLGLMAPVR